MAHRTRTLARIVGAAILAFTATIAGAVQVSGSFTIARASETTHVTYSCFGTPVCNGMYSQTGTLSDCSNGYSMSGDFSVTGVDLSRVGSFGGVITASGSVTITHNANGTCNYTYGTDSGSINYNGTWDGNKGTLSITAYDDNGQPFTVTGPFTATVPVTPPVFPMTVNGNITPTTANATADIKPRPQDVGKPASIYLFAHAPANVVKDALAPKLAQYGPQVLGFKDDEVSCVLAQVGADGRLHGASASTLAPYVTGVLTAQGMTVTLLNNVPTPNVAGATMYVGYGSTAAGMLADGLYQGAISVPGTVNCGTSLAAAAAPLSPGALSGLWYNSGESGWGIHFAQRRNILFAAWYTYDASGKPKWYVASSCEMPMGTTGTSGMCSGTLYEVTGPPYFGVAFDPMRVRGTPAGTLQVNFRDANNATMTYGVAGQSRTVAITRQVFRTGTTPPAVDYTDLWWNANESGWGMAISHQYGIMFLAWFVYDAAGKPMWYVASSCVVSGSGCSGTLYRTTGPAFGPAFDPNAVQGFAVGTASLAFTDANNGTLSFTVDGVKGTKAISRQAF